MGRPNCCACVVTSSQEFVIAVKKNRVSFLNVMQEMNDIGPSPSSGLVLVHLKESTVGIQVTEEMKGTKQTF